MEDDAVPAILCADGVVRALLGQWQGYLDAVARDPDESARRLKEVPAALRPAAQTHLRATLVRQWVQEVLQFHALDDRRAVIARCPSDLRDDVRDQVAVLFQLRRTRPARPCR
jgi:hypothetical protein